MTWVQTSETELVCLETGSRICVENCVGVITLFVRPAGHNGARVIARKDRAQLLFCRMKNSLICEYLDNYGDYEESSNE